jgi:hypothetical protein
MFARFRHISHRLIVDLVHSRRIGVGAQARTEYIGRLGSLAWAETLDPGARMKFWAELSHRFRAIGARRPGVVSAADEIKIRDAIAARIPPACNAE